MLFIHLAIAIFHDFIARKADRELSAFHNRVWASIAIAIRIKNNFILYDTAASKYREN